MNHRNFLKFGPFSIAPSHKAILLNETTFVDNDPGYLDMRIPKRNEIDLGLITDYQYPTIS